MFSTLMQLVRREIDEHRRIANVGELAKLSDHHLNDIGLRRDQLFMLESQARNDAPEQSPARTLAFQPNFEPCG